MLDIFPEKDLNDVICIYGGSFLETSMFKAGFLAQFEVFSGMLNVGFLFLLLPWKNWTSSVYFFNENRKVDWGVVSLVAPCRKAAWDMCGFSIQA